MGSEKMGSEKMGSERMRSGKIKRSTVRGSMTVEMSFLMPMILFLIMECILAVFYYHDKNILSGAAYETVVVGSTKMREKNGVKKGELENLFRQRSGGKCILFGTSEVTAAVSEEEVKVTVTASRRWMKVSVVKKAAVTEPETYIRDIRKLTGKKAEAG